MAPRALETLPRGPQELSKRPPEGPRGPLEGSRSAPEASQTPPRAPQERPRGPQERPGGVQERSKSPPKGPPRGQRSQDQILDPIRRLPGPILDSGAILHHSLDQHCGRLLLLFSGCPPLHKNLSGILQESLSDAVGIPTRQRDTRMELQPLVQFARWHSRV